MKCSKCGKEKDNPKNKNLPRGWKRIDAGELNGNSEEQIFCDDCWDSLYTLRMVAFQVVGPVVEESRKDFWNAINVSWKMVTAMSNWVVTECAKVEPPRLPGQTKISKIELPYLYPEARKLWPELSSVTVSAIERHVKQKYSSSRLEMWMGKRSMPNFRYPQPLPVPAANWTARWLTATEHVPIVSAPIAGVRFDIKLKGGPGFRPQRSDFGLLVEGKALKGEMLITQTGSKATARLILYVPKIIKAGPAPEKIMVVATDKVSLLIGAINEQEIWRFNADHGIRWVAEHSQRLGRLREDAKLERRTGEVPDPKTFRERIVQKHHSRMDTLVHQASAAAVNRAIRMKCNKIVFNGAEKGFIDSFPWFALRERIKIKAEAVGIAFEDVTPTQTDEAAEKS